MVLWIEYIILVSKYYATAREIKYMFGAVF